MTANTAALAGRLWQRSYWEPAGRRGTPSPEKAQLGAEIQGAPGFRSAPGESPGQLLGSLHGASSPERCSVERGVCSASSGQPVGWPQAPRPAAAAAL